MPAPWPLRDCVKVGILLPSCKEVEDALVDAREHLDDRSVNPNQPAAEQILRAEEEVQLIFRCTLEPGKTNPEARLFPSADYVRKHLDQDLRGYLIACIMDHQVQWQRCWPWPDRRMDAALRQVADLLGLGQGVTAEEVVSAVEAVVVAAKLEQAAE